MINSALPAATTVRLRRIAESTSGLSKAQAWTAIEARLKAAGLAGAGIEEEATYASDTHLTYS
jgi:hypothetical protein